MSRSPCTSGYERVKSYRNARIICQNVDEVVMMRAQVQQGKEDMMNECCGVMMECTESITNRNY